MLCGLLDDRAGILEEPADPVLIVVDGLGDGRVDAGLGHEHPGVLVALDELHVAFDGRRVGRRLPWLTLGLLRLLGLLEVLLELVGVRGNPLAETGVEVLLLKLALQHFGLPRPLGQRLKRGVVALAQHVIGQPKIELADCVGYGQELVLRLLT